MAENKYLVHEAIRENKTQLAKQLIDENAKLILTKDEDERTPLHWACSQNNLEMVEYLLKPRAAIAAIEVDDMVDASGWTPVHISASLGNVGILDAFLKSDSDIDINLTTNQGTTALHLAASKNRSNVVRMLVVDHKCSCRIKDNKGSTALHRAASIGSQPIVELLAGPGKANLNVKDIDGWTALHHALAEGHGDVAVKLVQLGADPSVVNDEGLKPIQVSVDEKVGRFFQQGISELHKNVN